VYSSEASFKASTDPNENELWTLTSSSSSSEYIQYKGYAGIVGNDLSCGTFGSQEAIEDYCNLNLDCKGYSYDSSSWSTSQGGPWLCAKTTSAKGNYDSSGVWYEKPLPPTSSACWTYLEGFYNPQNHGTCGSQTYDDVEEAKAACAANVECFGIAKQSNLCSGKYRTNIPKVHNMIFTFNPDWASIDQWSYRLDDRTGASCTGEVKSVASEFENLGAGYCRDSTGNFNTNWATNSYCEDLLTCQNKCHHLDNCVGVAWASVPTWDHSSCMSNSLPRCVVYYTKIESMYSVTPGTNYYEYAPTVVVAQASVSPGEYTVYRYIPASPTNAPTDVPTNAPTKEPTEVPTHVPTHGPTNAPTEAPTIAPTNAPTTAPTQAPTAEPTHAPTNAPTMTPTNAPTATPTFAPTTVSPTPNPTRKPTDVPTTNPSDSPSGSFFPSSAPTVNPTKSPAPSASPTAVPSASPTQEPTEVPTHVPTHGPTNVPTPGPTAGPTNAPTHAPTNVPTAGPTHGPTNAPTTTPTITPSDVPTGGPSNDPTAGPTNAPTTRKPTNAPIDLQTHAAKAQARTFPLLLGFKEECPEDILLLKQEGVANYPEDAIRTSIHIVRQEETTVTVELLQLFSHHMDYLFYQYNANVFNSKCYEQDNVVGGESIVEITIECTRTSQVAFLDLWLAEDGSSQGVVVDAQQQYITKNAIIPDCCYPDAVPKGTPVTYYSFQIKCDPHCDEGELAFGDTID